MKSIGFNIIGVLNNIGLFIVNNIGIIEVLLIVFNCFDLVMNVYIVVNIKVVLVFLSVVMKYEVLWVNVNDVCWFDWNNFKLVFIFVIYIVVIVGFIIEGLWILIN